MLKEIYSLNFNYQGQRDYVDMSQITEAFWRELEVDASLRDLKDVFVKVHQPVLSQAVAVLSDGQLKADSYALMSFKYQGRLFHYDIHPNGQAITNRIQEPAFNEQTMLKVDGDRVLLTESFVHPYPHVYLFMKMARKFVVDKYGAIRPRAVQFESPRLITPDEAKDLYMVAPRKPHKGFLRLDAYKGEEPLGVGYVRYFNE